jgi:hypothetical protein
MKVEWQVGVQTHQPACVQMCMMYASTVNHLGESVNASTFTNFSAYPHHTHPILTHTILVKCLLVHDTGESVIYLSNSDWEVDHRLWWDNLLFRVLGPRLVMLWTRPCVFFVFCGVKSGFSGLLVSNRVHKYGYYNKSSDMFWVTESHVLLCSCRRIMDDTMSKSTCTDFGGGGVWSALEWSFGR